MKIFYDIPYMQEIMKYVLIPVVAIVIIVGIILLIYSKRHKDHDSVQYNFVMNFWSSLIGIIITGAILAIAVGFSFAMTEKMREYGLIEEKKSLYYLLKYFIIIPFIFVVWYIVKFLKTVYYKPKREKKKKIVPQEDTQKEKMVSVENDSIASSVEEASISTANTTETILEQPEEVVEKPLPTIEETIQEEMKYFEKDESKPTEEEVEVISLEGE